MTLRHLRLLTVAAAVLAFVVPAAGNAARVEPTIDRGVVQSIGSDQIVLRSLDGSVASFAVSTRTRVKVNGVRASLHDIAPGFVARVVHDGGAPAVLVQAFGATTTLTDRGVVTALTKSAVTLRTPGGGTMTVPLDGSTRFRFLGVPGRRLLARPGAVVSVTRAADGPATVVNVLKRAGA
jgi:hypothetical protein